MPFVSEAQRKLMYAAAAGKKTKADISQAAAKKLVAEDEPGKLPEKVSKAAPEGDGSDMAKQLLAQINEMSEKLNQLIDSDQELEDWVDSKIVSAKKDLEDIAGYLSHNEDAQKSIHGSPNTPNRTVTRVDNMAKADDMGDYQKQAQGALDFRNQMKQFRREHGSTIMDIAGGKKIPGERADAYHAARGQLMVGQGVSHTDIPPRIPGHLIDRAPKQPQMPALPAAKSMDNKQSLAKSPTGPFNSGRSYFQGFDPDLKNQLSPEEQAKREEERKAAAAREAETVKQLNAKRMEEIKTEQARKEAIQKENARLKSLKEKYGNAKHTEVPESHHMFDELKQHLIDDRGMDEQQAHIQAGEVIKNTNSLALIPRKINAIKNGSPLDISNAEIMKMSKEKAQSKKESQLQETADRYKTFGQTTKSMEALTNPKSLLQKMDDCTKCMRKNLQKSNGEDEKKELDDFDRQKIADYASRGESLPNWVQYPHPDVHQDADAYNEDFGGDEAAKAVHKKKWLNNRNYRARYNDTAENLAWNKAFDYAKAGKIRLAGKNDYHPEDSGFHTDGFPTYAIDHPEYGEMELSLYDHAGNELHPKTHFRPSHKEILQEMKNPTRMQFWPVTKPEEDETSDLQKSSKKKSKPFHGYNKKKHARSGGLNDSYRKKLNRETGSNLKRPVTKKNVKPGSKAAKRRKSFCARMSGVKGPTSKEGKLTPKGAALKRWRCSKSLNKSESVPLELRAQRVLKSLGSLIKGDVIDFASKKKEKEQTKLLPKNLSLDRPYLSFHGTPEAKQAMIENLESRMARQWERNNPSPSKQAPLKLAPSIDQQSDKKMIGDLKSHLENPEMYDQKIRTERAQQTQMPENAPTKPPAFGNEVFQKFPREEARDLISDWGVDALGLTEHFHNAAQQLHESNLEDEGFSWDSDKGSYVDENGDEVDHEMYFPQDQEILDEMLDNGSHLFDWDAYEKNTQKSLGVARKLTDKEMEQRRIDKIASRAEYKPKEYKPTSALSPRKTSPWESAWNYKNKEQTPLQEKTQKSEKLVGGKGDHRSVSDFDPMQVKSGKKVEMEHTKDPAIAQEITKDHLSENPKYYSKLKAAGLADELNKAQEVLSKLEKRCWKGYKPVAGKKAYSKGSCEPVGKSQDTTNISAPAMESGKYQGEKLDAHHHNRLGREYKQLALNAHKSGDKEKAASYLDKASYHFSMADKKGYEPPND